MKNRLTIERISKVFKAFAERECKGVSTLYYQLSQEISEEKDLLKLTQNRRARQPIPNLFFGSIHYLLLKNQEEELAKFYPSISKKTSSKIPIKLIKEFCNRRENEIINLLKSRIVQTNAINRTAYLMPIVSSKFKSNNQLNLIDIGTSSGLTMHLDKYEYDYGENQFFGRSKVKIKTKLLAGKLPEFDKVKRIGRKIGIDQNPLDLKKGDNSIWLKSLIWPDLESRFERMESAIELIKESNIELIKANTSSEFIEVVEQIPKKEELLIYHTHVLYQFSKEERKEFRAMLDKVGAGRNYKYLAVEAGTVFDNDDYKGVVIKIELTEYKDGKKRVELLGETDGHANWIKWK